jgi:hypothetical protein
MEETCFGLILLTKKKEVSTFGFLFSVINN